MRSTLLFGARVIVGGYLAVHGAQKLFGAFGGPGLAKTAAGFERIGLAPGRQMAALAGAAELAAACSPWSAPLTRRAAGDHRHDGRRFGHAPGERPAGT